jgi:hypothetical protein
MMLLYSAPGVERCETRAGLWGGSNRIHESHLMYVKFRSARRRRGAAPIDAYAPRAYWKPKLANGLLRIAR